MNQKEIALFYASKGISVFPCNATSKSPITKNGFTEATTSKIQIEKWWNKTPNALIGSPNDNFTVIDVDCHGLCATGALLTENAHNDLRTEGVVTDTTLRVRTMSGGYHYYFKRDESITRSIKALPNIDLLGTGGYVILPDQQTYVCENYESPWEMIKKLQKLDVVTLSELTEKHEPYAQAAKLLKKESKKDSDIVSTRKKSAKQTATFATEELKEATQQGFYVIKDYKTNTFKFVYGNNVYARGQRRYEFDYKLKLRNEDGKIKLTKGMLDSEMMLGLYHNAEIQAILGKFLGLNVPPFGSSKGNKQRSVLPGHIDKKPSMSVRWVEGHIVARDHSNFFNEKHNQIDYDIVRLFMTQTYGTDTARPKIGERNMWFLKLMYDAGLLDVSDLKFDYYLEDSIEYHTEAQIKVIEGFRLLYMIKSAYKDFDETTLFSDRFAAGWCGVSTATVNSSKRHLIGSSFFANVDLYNCVNPEEGIKQDTPSLYESRLLRPIKTEEEWIELGYMNDLNEQEYRKRRAAAIKVLRDEKLNKQNETKPLEETVESEIVKLETVKLSKEEKDQILSEKLNKIKTYVKENKIIYLKSNENQIKLNQNITKNQIKLNQNITENKLTSNKTENQITLLKSNITLNKNKLTVNPDIGVLSKGDDLYTRTKQSMIDQSVNEYSPLDKYVEQLHHIEVKINSSDFSDFVNTS